MLGELSTDAASVLWYEKHANIIRTVMIEKIVIDELLCFDIALSPFNKEIL